MTWTADTDLPFGNACELVVHGDAPGVTVSFMPDPHGGPETLWFCLRVRRDVETARSPGRLAAQRIRLLLRNLGNTLGGGDPDRILPAARIDGRPWKRLDPGRSIEHRDGRIDAEWAVEGVTRSLEVAACYPYGPDEVEQLLNDLSGHARNRLQADTIGVSQGARPIVRLCNDYGRVGSKRPGIYIVARQHSGETPGSWVLDGLLRSLTSSTTQPDEKPLVWAVPLANIDGVIRGDYGKDNFPIDLNRAWGRPPMRHENLVIQRDIDQWRARCAPVLVLDLHAPGWCEDQGVYAFVPMGPTTDEVRRTTARWVETFRLALGSVNAAREFDRAALYPSRWSTPNLSRYALEFLRIPALSCEIPYSRIGDRPITQRGYREIGRRMAQAILRHTR